MQLSILRPLCNLFVLSMYSLLIAVLTIKYFRLNPKKRDLYQISFRKPNLLHFIQSKKYFCTFSLNARTLDNTYATIITRTFTIIVPKSRLKCQNFIYFTFFLIDMY